jgi:L-amino acid N-acyltransferase YncA
MKDFAILDFTVRRAQIEDASAIARVQVASWKTTYAGIVPAAYLASLNTEARTERWQEQFDSGLTLIFVAEDRDGVFGFVSGGRLREPIDDYEAELYAIYLLQHKQGRGAGKRLFDTLVAGLRAAGFRSLLVWVLEQNPAVDFYAHIGGSRVTQKPIEIGGAQLREVALGWSLES